MNRFIMFLSALAVTTAAMAKDMRTLVVTTNPPMHCESCENRIKKGLRFEKGVKSINTNLEQQTVTIKYDADKNTSSSLIKAFDEIGYEATEVQKTETPKNSKK